jgi:hypothetical protein
VAGSNWIVNHLFAGSMIFYKQITATSMLTPAGNGADKLPYQAGIAKSRKQAIKEY